MDYLALAGAFANIVSLIGMFKSEHQDNSVNQYSDFLKWLEEHHRNDVLQAIQSNHLLMQSLQNLLQNNQAELLEKITKIDTLLLEVLSNINEFSELTKAFPKQIRISEQAKFILNEMNKVNGSLFIVNTSSEGVRLLIVGYKCPKSLITLPEPRFVEDDLRQLCELGLLRIHFAKNGNKEFHITRLAAQLVVSNFQAA